MDKCTTNFVVVLVGFQIVESLPKFLPFCSHWNAVFMASSFSRLRANATHVFALNLQAVPMSLFICFPVESKKGDLDRKVLRSAGYTQSNAIITFGYEQ